MGGRGPKTAPGAKMKITAILIENYKSIKRLELRPGKGLNALIGANSAGKSNVFEAINWLLGPGYPSFNATKKEDRFLGEESNRIRIRLEFDDNFDLDLDESFGDGSLMRDGKRCSNQDRRKYCCAYLGVERHIVDYLPSNKWSLLGRILREINERFLAETARYNSETKLKSDWLKERLTSIRDELLFTVRDDDDQDVMKKFLTILQDETAKQLNKTPSDLTVDLSLYDPWDFYRTLQLIVREPEMGMEFQVSNLGMGVQASVSIAILRAYSELKLANNSPILIDEPELYLHPQAQRNFYSILRDLATDKRDEKGNLIREGTQVFYTTHSANFLSAGTFDEIFVVRKTRTDGTFFRNAKVNEFVEDLEIRKGIKSSEYGLLQFYRNAYENTGDSQRANEAFFAKKIILVEGQGEVLVLPYLFELVNFDLARECISIVRCGSKNEIDRFYRLYSEFGLPCYVIFDGDKGLEGTPDEKENLRKNKAIFELFGIDNLNYPDGAPKARYLGFEDKFETSLFETSKKGLDLYIEVKQRIAMGSFQVPSWIEDLRDQIAALSENAVPSILKRSTLSG
jgi:putative ATP-dependent endonuclease of the OLD family